MPARRPARDAARGSLRRFMFQWGVLQGSPFFSLLGLNHLYRAIRKMSFFPPIGCDKLDGAVGKEDFLRAVCVMFLTLAIDELEFLKAVRVGGLRGASFSIVVHHPAIAENLLVIAVHEVNNAVTLGEDFLPRSVSIDNYPPPIF